MRLPSLFLLAAVATSQAIAAPVIKISFVHGMPQTTPYNIDSLANISSIYTSGPNAWATDGAGNYASFNGQNWNAVNIPGANSITTISSAYPVTGQDSTAWALVSTSSGAAISYFNGISWSPPELITTILQVSSLPNYNFSIATSGGAVFLAASSSSTHVDYLAVKKPSGDWHTQQILGSSGYLAMDAFDDSNPVLNFIAQNTTTQAPMLYRLDSDGNITSEPNAMGSDLSFVNYLFAAGPEVILNYSTMTNTMAAYKDFSTQNNWQQVTALNMGSTLRADSYNNGLLCEIGQAENSIFACLNTSQLQNQWQQWPLVTPEQQMATYQLLPRSDNGAWLNFYTYNSGAGAIAAAKIYNYDNQTNTATDIHFPLANFPNTRSSVITEVGTDNLMACVGDAYGTKSQQPLQLYYYNGQGWSTIKLSRT
ncbi:MAG: hypothetical protein K5Q00_06010, partial [Gammaproteobacteria bacterium]|nr:hypothetical protein [Gammaproteobacteria bacterium]